MFYFFCKLSKVCCIINKIISNKTLQLIIRIVEKIVGLKKNQIKKNCNSTKKQKHKRTKNFPIQNDEDSNNR